MAAECARNALLQKAMDNKQDSGINYFKLCLCLIILCSLLRINPKI